MVALWFPPMRSPVVTRLTGLLGQIGTGPGVLARGPRSPSA
jgi:hypothetical protein